MEPGADGVIRTLIEKADEPGQQEFLPFLYLWMAFNGWMTAVTERHTDAQMLRDVKRNARLQKTYDTRGARKALGLETFRQMSREAVLAACPSVGVDVDPAGWIPGALPSWEQLLSGLYRVRCNLFHGQKSPALARDRDLVTAGGIVLRTLIAEAGFLDWNTEA
jgi:hypothetical protein